MLQKQSLFELLKHIWQDIILPKKQSSLIMYLLTLAILYTSQSFTFVLILSIPLSIAFVYLVLSPEDDLINQQLFVAVKQNFFAVLGVMMMNAMILIACAATTTGCLMFLASMPSLLKLVLALGVIPALVFILSMMHFNVYQVIIGQLRVTEALTRGWNTARTYFGLTLKLYLLVFSLQALFGIVSSTYAAALLSMVMQLCIISITIDSAKNQHVSKK